ncbi:MAG: amidase [Alphaproteobacteria bacterium]|nr:amidase [Alphaproteobacteria bacterium]
MNALDLSAAQLIDAYRAGTLSPVETAQAALDRAERLNGPLNAFSLIDREPALAAARASEARWRRGEPCGLLDGVPVTVKDALLVKDWPMRRGSKTIAVDGPWSEDSPAVARCREHGAVLFAQTTAPEFSWKGVTDSPLRGITRNPWNPALTPGGSSGGAAAAVAAGIGPLHLGGDGGGSLRIPAAFVGAYGFKPESGRIPLYPQSSPGAVGAIGPITRTVADAALALTVMAAPDARDWWALPHGARDYQLGPDDGLRGVRVAFSRNFGSVTVDPVIERLVEAAVGDLEAAGATVEEADPGFSSPRDTYYTLMCATYGHALSLMAPERQALLDPGLRAVIADFQALTPAAIAAALLARAVLGQVMAGFHQRFDLLVSPQLPLVAFAAGHEVPPGSGFQRWLDWSPFTYPFNLTQQPAASVPVGLAHGLPAAIQIVGPRSGESLVLRASRAIERTRPFPRCPPLAA